MTKHEPSVTDKDYKGKVHWILHLGIVKYKMLVKSMGFGLKNILGAHNDSAITCTSHFPSPGLSFPKSKIGIIVSIS